MSNENTRIRRAEGISGANGTRGAGWIRGTDGTRRGSGIRGLFDSIFGWNRPKQIEKALDILESTAREFGIELPRRNYD